MSCFERGRWPVAQGRWPASRSHAQAAAAAEGRQGGSRAAREGIGGTVPIAYELAAELAADSAADWTAALPRRVVQRAAEARQRGLAWILKCCQFPDYPQECQLCLR